MKENIFKPVQYDSQLTTHSTASIFQLQLQLASINIITTIIIFQQFKCLDYTLMLMRLTLLEEDMFLLRKHLLHI